MAEPKTKANDASVEDFLNSIPDPRAREDCHAIAAIMQSAAKTKPRMWGSNIVGFAEYRYRYADGRQADWPLIAFSPRKQNITLYISSGFDQYEELLSRLGKHSCGKSCLYIKRLAGIDLPVLKKLVQASVRHRLKAAKAQGV
jgi:hypothetical protein